MGPPGATTRLAAVIGDPIAHSRSPAILNAAFDALGLDWTYLAFEVRSGQGAAAVEAMRTLGIAGMSVTMPHKQDVIAALDSVDPTAELLGAVNCIAAQGGLLVGHNTDGDGYLASLAAEGFDPRGARCVVMGAGGAARAVILALARAGAAEVLVVNRDQARGAGAALLAGERGRAATADELGEILPGADLLVNATPLGMHSGDPILVDPARLDPSLFVSDLVYHPARTALLDAADAVGARWANGLGMLVHQAAAALSIWTGADAPLDAMFRAASVGSGDAKS